MKKIYISSFIALFILLSTISFKETSSQAPNILIQKNTFEIKIKEKKIIKDPSVENRKFLKQLSKFESGNNYQISRGNYLGKYQFHIVTLKEIGYDINPDSFRLNPEIFNEYEQEVAIRKLIKYHKFILRDQIQKYHNQTFCIKIDSVYKEVKVTKAGILAAAHLGGVKSTIDLFESNGEKNFKDGYGTPISFYLEKFSGFEVDF